MRILKFLAAAFVTALAAGSLQAQRPDSDLQAKAREALRQAELQQDTAPTNQVAPPKKMKAMPPVAAPAPVVAAPATTPDADAKAREQLRRAEADNASQAQPPVDADAARAEHLRQLEAARAAQAAATPPPAVVPAPAPVVEISPAPPASTLSGGLSPDAEAKAREAMRQAMVESTPTPAATPAKSTPGWDQTPAAVKPMPVPAPQPKVVYTPTPAPGKSGFETSVTTAATVSSPAPAMTAKQQRLADLLNRYKMDQISPQEYFQQKANILAEP